MKIVSKETKTGANESQQYQHSANFLLRNKDATQTDGRNNRKARSQAVQAVNKIKSVDDGDEPNNNQQAVNGNRKRVSPNRSEARARKGHQQSGQCLAT